MSDLVERLRSPATVFYEYDADQGALLREAAARIEALEAGLKPFADRYTWIIETFGGNHMTRQILVDWDAVEVASSLLEKKGSG